MWRLCIWNWDVCIWGLRRRHTESELWRRYIYTYLVCWCINKDKVKMETYVNVTVFEMIVNSVFFLSTGSCHHGGGSWERSPLCSWSQTRNWGAEVNEVEQEEQKRLRREMLNWGTSLKTTKSQLHATHLIPLPFCRPLQCLSCLSLEGSLSFLKCIVNIFWLRMTMFCFRL